MKSNSFTCIWAVVHTSYCARGRGAGAEFAAPVSKSTLPCARQRDCICCISGSSAVEVQSVRECSRAGVADPEARDATERANCCYSLPKRRQHEERASPHCHQRRLHRKGLAVYRPVMSNSGWHSTRFKVAKNGRPSLAASAGPLAHNAQRESHDSAGSTLISWKFSSKAP